MDFITRWEQSGASERANFQSFLLELCDVLGVERPQPAQGDDRLNAYVFEKPVTFHNPDGSKSIGFIDLYRRDSFVLEAKQGGEKAVQSVAPKVKPVFPKELAEQAKAVRGMLAALGVADGQSVAKAFKSARVDRVVGLLDTLVSLGQARQLDDGRFTI